MFVITDMFFFSHGDIELQRVRSDENLIIWFSFRSPGVGISAKVYSPLSADGILPRRGGIVFRVLGLTISLFIASWTGCCLGLEDFRKECEGWRWAVLHERNCSENDLQTANYPLLDEWNGFWVRNMSSAVSNVFPVVASQFSGGEK